MNFSTVALFGRHQDTDMNKPIRELAQFLEANHINVLIESDTAHFTGVEEYTVATLAEIGEQADLAIVMGGDGTVLGVSRLLASFNIPLVGINHGRLGFITDIPLGSAIDALKQILEGHYITEKRTFLQGHVSRESQPLASALALNDVVINRSGHGGMIETRVEFNDEHMYTQRTDGLIVATPTGSTAYSLSANGPILHPSLGAFLLVPVAAQSLSTRPIVIPDTGTLTLTITEVSRGGQNATVHFDMQTWSNLQVGDKVVVKKAPNEITFLHPSGYSFFSTLRKKLHWNTMPEIG